MTTIKRFTPDYKMHAVRFEAFAREAEHGELVQFDDHQQVVSTLEAERDALAVENAGFKHALSVILEHVDVTDKGQAGVVAMIANDELFNSETPATDAALAAIQAQGVEKFAAWASEQESMASDSSDKKEARIYCQVAARAKHFAKQLREAK
ncbi:hypothetical protein ACAX60_000994 [Serratia marcescens]|uniref:hypothetical protein n=1 Tax=Serratia marcescens TaxID=615 RepID=UPI000A8BDB1F|nr:hypothetical protein [Serratia marcescens]